MPFGGASHSGDQIFQTPGAKTWHYDTEACALSVTYPLFGSALADTRHNPSHKSLTKLTDIPSHPEKMPVPISIIYLVASYFKLASYI